MLMRIAVLLLLVVLCGPSAIAQDGKRFALLIGNAAYNDAVGPLTNPGNDIALVGDTLEKLGFKITKIENASLGQLYTALNAHTRRVRRAGDGAVSFFYYSGHGAQDPETRTNYLIPVDVPSTLDSDLWDRSLQLSIVTQQLKQKASNATHFVVFDACRNALKVRKAGAKSAVATKGFVPIPKVTGMLVAYATAQGETASDIGNGAGPYARVLAEELIKPGIEAVSMFRNVQVRVFEQIRQEPWLDFGYLSRIYFAGREAVKRPAKPQPPLSEVAQAWAVTQTSTSLPVLEAFERRYRDTVFGELARARIAELKGNQVASAAPVKPPASPTCDGVEVSLGSGSKVCIQPGSGKSFRDCPTCPEMVVVPAGKFLIGSSQSEAGRSNAEGPVQHIMFSHPFAVGRFEITRKEFVEFLTATGYDIGESCWTWRRTGGWKDRSQRSFFAPGFRQSNRDPAVCINWYDAAAYADWLKERTGREYQLPSEAQWEYFARAATLGAFSFQGAISTSKANYDGSSYAGSQIGVKRGRTLKVGSFAPNPWGLFDIHGNAWEWTRDCWNESYTGMPTDGSPRLDGDCSLRVFRGGAWFNKPVHLRSATRFTVDAHARNQIYGMRVVRAMLNKN